MKKFLCLFLIVLMTGNLFVSCISADSRRDFTEETKAAEQLKALGLFKGVSDTDFDLERAPSRIEALVMLIRILGKESEALAGSNDHPFTDVPEWAAPYVSFAYSNGLTNGVSANEFGTADASAATYLTFVLRALGYSDTNGTDFTWDNPFDLAKKVGILTDNVDTDRFLRADVAIVSQNALFAKIKNTETNLAERLIADGVFTKEAYYEVFPDVADLEDVSKKQPVVMSFRSAYDTSYNGELYQHAEPLTESGVWNYDAEEKAVAISDAGTHQYWPNYRIMPKFLSSNSLSEEYKYVCVVYKSTASEWEFKLLNNGNPSQTWNITTANAKADTWLVTDPIDLTQYEGVLLDRYNRMSWGTYGFTTTANNATFYVKEIAFFTSIQQAKEWYKDLDAYITKTDAAAIMSQSDIDPIIYKFTSENQMLQSGVMFYDHGDTSPTEEGVFEFAQVGEENALRLYYDRHNWGNYRVMFRPSSLARAERFKKSDTWYVRVRYKTNAATNSTLNLTNNLLGDSITLEHSFSNQIDDWRISGPMKMPDDFVARLLGNRWLTLGFGFTQDDLEVYISEIAFFPTLDSACEYYGDILPEDVIAMTSQPTVMQMNDTASVGILEADDKSDIAGNWERNELSGNVVLKYTEYDAHNWGHYRFMPKFTKVTAAMSEAKYFRIVYKATNPENQTEPVALKVVSNGVPSVINVDNDVKNTDGKWVVSPTQQLSSIIHERWLSVTNNMHCTVSFFADNPGGVYEVREIVFFNTLEEASSYELANESAVLTIAGNSIDKYAIVMPDNAGKRTEMAVDALRSHIYRITGMSLDIITDAEPEREYEIVVGNTSRAVSAPYYNGTNGKYVIGELAREDYAVYVTNGDLVITGGAEISVQDGMTEFLSTYFGYQWTDLPDTIDLQEGFEVQGGTSLAEYTGTWDDPSPVADPYVFTDNFDDEVAGTSPDYWVEAYATDNWKVQAEGHNNVYSTAASDFTYTRLHVYERDIDYTVKMRFDTLHNDSDAGVLVRYNDIGAYVRVGYKAGQWYLQFSEGQEFNVYTLDTESAELKAGTWYTIRVIAQKNDVKAYIDGTLTLESTYVTHISPGPMGMFAQNAAVSFDDVSVTLISGQGQVMKGVTDSTFWTSDGGLCSGSVIEMQDGKLRYVNANESHHYVSSDGGLTWTNEKFTDFSTDCVNVFRLQSGNLIKLMEDTVDGKLVHVTYTSEDDGKTWMRGGVVAEHDYMGYGTMIQTIENDKFTQVSNGRIFLSQNYQGTIPSGAPNDHIKVFNEMWYSDDEGKTWTKSQMSSFDCTDLTHFGESKVIETADGALLWITPWNNAGYIIASESTDNGVTWGEFYNLTEFPCSISSFGIMRDVYADNSTTYYMAWVYNEPSKTNMPRSRLCIAMTTDGRNWTFLGDVYRWENSMCGASGSSSTALLNHIVDPFITVTKEYIFVGSGVSARRSYVSNGFHNNQQQKIYRIEKSSLTAYDEFPNY